MAAKNLIMCLVCLLNFAAIVGCSEPKPVSIKDCVVEIEGSPVADVRVVLLVPDNGGGDQKFRPVMEGVTDVTGKAALFPIGEFTWSAGEQIEFRATVESLGGGDWQIISPWNDPVATPLTVTSDRGPESIKIELTKKSIKML